MKLINATLAFLLSSIVTAAAQSASNPIKDARGNTLYCPNTHTTQTQISQAIQNSPTVPQSIKNTPCGYAAMAAQESGDGTTANQCIKNPSCCTGVLQLYGRGLLQAGYVTSDGKPDYARYANASLQEQIDAWGKTAASNISSNGYKALDNAYNNGGYLNGQKVTAGTLAACEQFGPQQCNENVAAIRNGNGCGHGINGNPSICQWGNSMDKIASKGNCSTNGNNRNDGGCPSGDFPTTPAPGTPAAALSA